MCPTPSSVRLNLGSSLLLFKKGLQNKLNIHLLLKHAAIAWYVGAGADQATRGCRRDIQMDFLEKSTPSLHPSFGFRVSGLVYTLDPKPYTLHHELELTNHKLEPTGYNLEPTDDELEQGDHKLEL